MELPTWPGLELSVSGATQQDYLFLGAPWSFLQTKRRKRRSA
jgi:hypothetical protein